MFFCLFNIKTATTQNTFKKHSYGLLIYQSGTSSRNQGNKKQTQFKPNHHYKSLYKNLSL